MNYIAYSSRPGSNLKPIYQHFDEAQAVKYAENYLNQWKQMGVSAPNVEVHYNGFKSTPVWRNGERLPLPVIS